MGRIKGFKHTKRTKNKISSAHKGFKYSEETKKKLSKIKKLKPTNYWLGKKRGSPSKETKLKMRISHLGEKSNLWKGGISFEPYGLEFNEDLREVIRNRDRRKCRICEKTELEEGKKLSCHHIDYNKRNNDPINLISLCIKCHSKTNGNRNYWIKYF